MSKQGEIMKKTTKIFAVTCGALALFACKTDIEKTVNLTDVTDQKMHLENADLNVEISSCSNYEDSRTRITPPCVVPFPVSNFSLLLGFKPFGLSSRKVPNKPRDPSVASNSS